MTNYSNYPSFLEEIRKRPTMWFGGEERSTRLLYAFLCGFSQAEGFYKVSADTRLSDFDWEQFEQWIEKEFNPKKLSLNSFTLASFLSESEPKAFDLWYSWYDKYRSLNTLNTSHFHD